jgi:hypothetical protein
MRDQKMIISSATFPREALDKSSLSALLVKSG